MNKINPVSLPLYFLLLLSLSLTGCPQSSFEDDFADGIVDPAYRFFHGGPSDVAEGEGVLSLLDTVNLGLTAIPGDPFPPTEIRPGVDLGLRIVDSHGSGLTTLCLGDNRFPFVMEDYFCIGMVFGVPACFTEEEMAGIGEYPDTPVEVTIACEPDGTVTGTFTYEGETHECGPLESASIQGNALNAVISQGVKTEPGREQGEVDDFSVRLRGE